MSSRFVILLDIECSALIFPDRLLHSLNELVTFPFWPGVRWVFIDHHLSVYARIALIISPKLDNRYSIYQHSMRTLYSSQIHCPRHLQRSMPCICQASDEFIAVNIPRASSYWVAHAYRPSGQSDPFPRRITATRASKRIRCVHIRVHNLQSVLGFHTAPFAPLDVIHPSSSCSFPFPCTFI